jgi:hypothetical protein
MEIENVAALATHAASPLSGARTASVCGTRSGVELHMRQFLGNFP